MSKASGTIWLAGLALAAIIIFSATPALAVEDTFNVIVDSGGSVVEGGGSGFNGGEWYYYDNTDWWNQWFYNDPYDPDRWKEIDVYMEVLPYWPNAYAEITINWSNPDWSPNPGEPPLPPLTPDEEALYISRLDPPLFVGEVTGTIILDITDIIIPDYNPEWVSIDVRGYGFGIVNGWIDHRCVPEPATLSLLVLGGCLSLLRKRK